MQITDTALIQEQINNATIIEDGLTVFCAQGRVVIEMLVYRGSKDTGRTDQQGRPIVLDYDIYEIEVGELRSEDGLDLTELSQFQGLSKEQLSNYDLIAHEFYSSAQEAHARIGMLIATHNHF